MPGPQVADDPFGSLLLHCVVKRPKIAPPGFALRRARPSQKTPARLPARPPSADTTAIAPKPLQLRAPATARLPRLALSNRPTAAPNSPRLPLPKSPSAHTGPTNANTNSRPHSPSSLFLGLLQQLCHEARSSGEGPWLSISFDYPILFPLGYSPKQAVAEATVPKKIASEKPQIHYFARPMPCSSPATTAIPSKAVMTRATGKGSRSVPKIDVLLMTAATIPTLSPSRM